MGSSPLYLAIVVVWLIVLVPMLLRRDAGDAAPGPARRDGQGVPGEDGVEPEDLDDEVDEYAFFEADADAIDADAEADSAPRWARASSVAATADATTNAGAEGVGDEDAGRRVSGRPRAGAEATDEADTVTATYAEPPPSRPVRPRVSRARIIARRRRRTSGLVLLLAVTGVAVTLGLGPWWVLVPPTVLLVGHLALLREAAKADSDHRAAVARHRRRLHAQRTAEAAREAEVIELMSRRNQVYDQYADAQLRAAGD